MIGQIVAIAATYQEHSVKSFFCSNEPIMMKARQLPTDERKRNDPTYRKNLKNIIFNMS